MLSKREVAELNAKNGGWADVCNTCPFWGYECGGGDFLSKSSCELFCTKWLKDNPDDKAEEDKTKSTIEKWSKSCEEDDTDATEVLKRGKWGCLYPLDVEKCDNSEEWSIIDNKFHSIYASHEAMLLEKNKRYGDSALNPVKVFASHLDDVDSILIRLDDKISRIRNSEEIRKNDVSDLMGYCVLLCKAKGWEDFMDQVD